MKISYSQIVYSELVKKYKGTETINKRFYLKGAKTK